MTDANREICSRVRIVKIKDSAFGGKHPNEIYEGFTREGFLFKVPRVGERMAILPSKLWKMDVLLEAFITSTVTEVKIGEIHTKNSIYSIEVENFDESGVPFFEKLDVEKMFGQIIDSGD